MKSLSFCRPTSSCCWFNLFIFFVVSSILFNTQSFGQSGDIDQIRNGPASNPQKNFYKTFNNPTWVNGNAGSSDAHYMESHSIAYRSLITGVSASSSYEYVIEYDTKHSERMAIDYLTHYQRLEPHGPFGHSAEVIDPRIFVSGNKEYLLGGGLISPSTFPIPAPFQSNSNTPVSGMPQNSFNALPSSERLMTIYNGTITSITYDSQDPLTTGSAQSMARVRIRFTAARDSVVLAWGGHIASFLDWGYLNPTTPRSASGISGSPYHMRQKSMNTYPGLVTISGVGNQDRSLSAAAVIPPPACTLTPAQLACPETPFLIFKYTAPTTGVTFVWSLSNNTAGAAIDGTVGANRDSVKIVPSGARFTPGGTFDLTLAATKNGITSTCSLTPAATIQNVQVTASASPTTIDMAVGNTSQLSAAVSPGVHADYTYSWTQDPASGGSLSASNIYNPVFTATSAGDYKFIVTITQIAAPNCSAKDSVVVSVVASAPPCGVAGPSPICPGSTNSYVYDPSNDGGAAEALPANYTASWSLINNTNGASTSGSTTGNSVSVIAGVTCATSYTVRITLTSTSGLISVHCDKVVSVNDVTPPTITSCPADIVVQCIGDTAAANTGIMTATDNCSVSISHSNVVVPGCVTVITRTWVATDPCGNTSTCVQHIIVRDRTAPSITCNAYPAAPTVSDNCTATVSIIVYYRDAGTTRTWTAIDESGNTNTCNQTIPSSSPVPPNVTTSGNGNNGGTSNSTTDVVPPKVEKSDNRTDLAIQANPNPFNSMVNFHFVSQISGQGNLEVYNMLGAKVLSVFNGKVDAGVHYNVKYRPASWIGDALIYRLTVGSKSISGRILRLH